MTDISSKALYGSILRMKEAITALDLELSALKEQLARLLKRCAPKDVKAIAYEPNRSGGMPTLEQAQIERIAHLTYQIGIREEDLATQAGAYDKAIRSLRAMERKLAPEDITTTVFIKAFVEGKPNKVIAAEMGYLGENGFKAIEYHKTKIYNELEIL